MLRFSRILCVLLIICIASTVFAMLVGGRLHPNWSGYFPHMDMCGDRLCFLGIVPGITTWDDAKKILAPYGYTGLQGFPDSITGQADHIEFVVSKSDLNVINWVYVLYETSLSPVTMKAIIARFSTPCRIGLGDDSAEVLTLTYPTMNVGVPDNFSDVPSWVTDNTYSPDGPVHFSFEGSISCDRPLSWRGIRSLSCYWQQEESN